MEKVENYDLKKIITMEMSNNTQKAMIESQKYCEKSKTRL